MIAAGLLGELPLDSSTAIVSIGFKRQPEIVGDFMITAHPDQRFGKMRDCSSKLPENHLQTPCRTIQSDAVGEMRESPLVGLQRDQQFTVTLLIGPERHKVVGTTIAF